MTIDWYLSEATQATVDLLNELQITDLFPKKGSYGLIF